MSQLHAVGDRCVPGRIAVAAREAPWSGTALDDVLAVILANSRVPSSATAICVRNGPRSAWRPAPVELTLGHGGMRRLLRQMTALQDYSATLMRSALRTPSPRAPIARPMCSTTGCGASLLTIAVAVTIRGGKARVDFTGSAPQTRGPLNANIAVTRSAVLYVSTALAPPAIPPNEGLARPLDIVAPERSIVNAGFPAAVSGGNVDVTTDRRRPPAGARARSSIPRAGGELGQYEQRRARRRRRRAAVRLLRDVGGRCRRGTGRGRGVRHPHAHDEHDEHARRGARGVSSAARATIRAAAALGRGTPSRGLRHRPRDRVHGGPRK